MVAVVDPLGVGWNGCCALVGHQPSGCGGGLEGGLVGWSLRGGWMSGLMNHPLSRGRIRGLWYVVLVSEIQKKSIVNQEIKLKLYILKIKVHTLN